MPAIRGIYYNHPQTTEAGLWVVLLNGNIIGRTDAQIAAMVPKTGSPATKIARFKAAFEAYLQPSLEERTPLSNWTPEEQVDLAAIALDPDSYCRIDGSAFVARLSVVTIEVISLSPLRYQITVSEGASKGEWKYA